MRAAEAGAVSAALHPRRRARRKSGGFWSLFARRRRHPGNASPGSADAAGAARYYPASLAGASAASRRAKSGDLPTYARHAGDWEADVRRQAGYGGKWTPARRDSPAAAAQQDPPPASSVLRMAGECWRRCDRSVSDRTR